MDMTGGIQADQALCVSASKYENIQAIPDLLQCSCSNKIHPIARPLHLGSLGFCLLQGNATQPAAPHSARF